jgi:hypothetical protein
MAELAALQRRFYDRVTAGVPSDDLVASGSLEIYAGMYGSRLHDALADDYPKLRAALGDDAFAAMVAAYLEARPPRSFTLRDAGLALPGWLRDHAPAPPWAAELAALERARIEVFDGPDAVPLVHADVVALGEQLPELVLRWVPSSAVVALGWTVDDLWSAIEDGQPVVEPTPEPRVVLVWRRGVSVLHRTLDPDEASLAPPIVCGARFADLCEVLGALHGDSAGARAVELVMCWLEVEAVVAREAAGGPAPRVDE